MAGYLSFPPVLILEIFHSKLKKSQQMKKLFIVLAVATLGFAACNSEGEKTESTDSPAVKVDSPTVAPVTPVDSPVAPIDSPAAKVDSPAKK